jgi:hypothetical protein
VARANTTVGVSPETFLLLLLMAYSDVKKGASFVHIFVEGRQYHLNGVSRYDNLGFLEIQGHDFLVLRMCTAEVSVHDCEHMPVR